MKVAGTSKAMKSMKEGIDGYTPLITKPSASIITTENQLKSIHLHTHIRKEKIEKEWLRPSATPILASMLRYEIPSSWKIRRRKLINQAERKSAPATSAKIIRRKWPKWPWRKYLRHRNLREEKMSKWNEIMSKKLREKYWRKPSPHLPWKK